MTESKSKNKLRKILKSLGPGFITGASDDDPSGIATYSQTGAMFGYGQLWTAFFSYPLTATIQEMCGRIGIITGKGLAGVIKTHYSRKLLYFAVSLLFIANTINIGADLGAMAASAQFVVGWPFVVWLLIMTVTTLVLEIFVSYKVYSKYLKFLTLSLLAYVLTFFVVKQDWSKIITSTLIPFIAFNREYLMNLVAILGTTISPYLFFWQASEEVEEEVAEHKIRIMGRGIPKFTSMDIKGMRVDTLLGMLFSNLTMFFIIGTTAATLHLSGLTQINTAAEAAQALKPMAGDFASLIFAVGVIGIGLLAVPVLSGSASYAIAETFGWKEGLYRKVTQAHGFYGVITIATLVGLLINFTRVAPFRVLYYTAVLNGLVAPPLLIIIMLISNNEKIMGKYKNKRLSNILGWTTVAVMSIASIALILS